MKWRFHCISASACVGRALDVFVNGNVTPCVSARRHHHGADHVHHHHGGQRLHAEGVLHQGGGHLPLGQLRLRLPVGDRVRGGQLPLHRAGEEREEAEGAGKSPTRLVETCRLAAGIAAFI